MGNMLGSHVVVDCNKNSSGQIHFWAQEQMERHGQKDSLLVFCKMTGLVLEKLKSEDQMHTKQ